MKIVNDRLSKDVGEDIEIEFVNSPHVINTIQKSRDKIVVHAPQGRTLEGAKAGFMAPAPKNGGIQRSVHLAIDQDGGRIVQFVPFNKVANHTLGNNSTSLAVELVYAGRLITDQRKPGFHLMTAYKDEFQGSQYIYASALNDAHYHYWPLFPQAQLDVLYGVAKLIRDSYGLTDFLGYEEIVPMVHPGPAFPAVQFREKLLGVSGHSIVLQETSKSVMLRGEPGKDETTLSTMTIPSGTPVSVINEMSVPRKGNWYLISVIDKREGSPWLIGWVEADSVRVNTNFHATVNEKHYLTTDEGRRFQEIKSHPNGYDAKKTMSAPKYIIMHFTTGTKMESTISHFTNPSAGVSTHLLIGRDGRVVQFLPFDRIAYHTGYSWWEQESNLNTCSIGIELDNAGLLTRGRGGKWLSRKVEVPTMKVKQAVHWKQYTPNDKRRYPGWEVFPKTQLDVALNIVKALRDRYPSIVEILGHDDVNLRNRYDPGPLFPMKKFRKELFNRLEPDIQVYEINQDTNLYGNFKGRLPNTKQDTFDVMLPADSIVQVMIAEDDFSLVAVLNSKDANIKGIGWIQTASLGFLSDMSTGNGNKDGKAKKGVEKRITKISQPIYKQGEGSPTPVLGEGLFKKGTKVRIQQVRGAWTLVVVLDQVMGRGGLEGWMPTEFLTPEITP